MESKILEVGNDNILISLFDRLKRTVQWHYKLVK